MNHQFDLKIRWILRRIVLAPHSIKMSLMRKGILTNFCLLYVSIIKLNLDTPNVFQIHIPVPIVNKSEHRSLGFKYRLR